MPKVSDMEVCETRRINAHFAPDGNISNAGIKEAMDH